MAIVILTGKVTVRPERHGARLLAIPLTALLVLGACGGDDGDGTTSSMDADPLTHSLKRGSFASGYLTRICRLFLLRPARIARALSLQ